MFNKLFIDVGLLVLLYPVAIFNTYIPLADPGGGALGLDPRIVPVYAAVNQLSYVCMLGKQSNLMSA